MRVFSYIVAIDAGFAPNSFRGLCTLATCKPRIRKYAMIGDWIVGLSSKGEGNKFIYAMKVTEVMEYSEYYKDKRFQSKIPDCNHKDFMHLCGDNIYEPLGNNEYRQQPSFHVEKDKAHDLGSKRVLISDEFYYYGSKAKELPPELNQLKVLRGHKCRFDKQVIANVMSFIKTLDQGIDGDPTMWSNPKAMDKIVNKCLQRTV